MHEKNCIKSLCLDKLETPNYYYQKEGNIRYYVLDLKHTAPTFIKQAKEEGFDHIAFLFDGVAKIEKEHEERYLKLLSNVENEKVFSGEESDTWICGICGFKYTGVNAPKACPVCGYPQAVFRKEAKNY